MQKKLKLDVDRLAVEQFQPGAPADAAPGTVHGHMVTNAYTEPCRYCLPMPITFTCE